MKNKLVSFALFCALSSMLGAQSANVNRAEGEFPGLQLLPPGSVVKGLSLPRYENHRVSALLQADELRVISRQEISLTDILADLYAEDGAVTSVRCKIAGYNFKKKAVETQADAEVKHPDFTAKGQGVVFSTARRIGFVKGPVRTTIRTENKNAK